MGNTRDSEYIVRRRCIFDFEADDMTYRELLDIYKGLQKNLNKVRIPSGMTAEQALTKIGKLCRIYRIFKAKQNNDGLIGGRILDFC